MSIPVSPARLHVLMAREAPFGLILRRGPSKQVCTIGWNRTNDTFELGQWLKGRIYEHRCDLSPDGEYFLYLAAKHHAWFGATLANPYIWTAVSRAPYLKAVALWGQDETFGGGGQFLGDRLYFGDKIQRESPDEQRHFGRPSLPYLWDSGPEEIYGFRLGREGWRRAESEASAKRPGCDTLLWEKICSSWTLQQFSHADLNAPLERGVYWQSYEAQDLVTGETLGDQSWEWADFDGDRLVWAQSGKLFALKIWDGGRGDILELADFNSWKFKNIVAPY